MEVDLPMDGIVRLPGEASNPDSQTPSADRPDEPMPPAHAAGAAPAADSAPTPEVRQPQPPRSSGPLAAAAANGTVPVTDASQAPGPPTHPSPAAPLAPPPAPAAELSAARGAPAATSAAVPNGVASAHLELAAGNSGNGGNGGNGGSRQEPMLIETLGALDECIVALKSWAQEENGRDVAAAFDALLPRVRAEYPGAEVVAEQLFSILFPQHIGVGFTNHEPDVPEYRIAYYEPQSDATPGAADGRASDSAGRLVVSVGYGQPPERPPTAVSAAPLADAAAASNVLADSAGSGVRASVDEDSDDDDDANSAERGTADYADDEADAYDKDADLDALAMADADLELSESEYDLAAEAPDADREASVESERPRHRVRESERGDTRRSVERRSRSPSRSPRAKSRDAAASARPRTRESAAAEPTRPRRVVSEILAAARKLEEELERRRQKFSRQPLAAEAREPPASRAAFRSVAGAESKAAAASASASAAKASSTSKRTSSAPRPDADGTRTRAAAPRDGLAARGGWNEALATGARLAREYITKREQKQQRLSVDRGREPERRDDGARHGSRDRDRGGRSPIVAVYREKPAPRDSAPRPRERPVTAQPVPAASSPRLSRAAPMLQRVIPRDESYHGLSYRPHYTSAGVPVSYVNKEREPERREPERREPERREPARREPERRDQDRREPDRRPRERSPAPRDRAPGLRSRTPPGEPPDHRPPLLRARTPPTPPRGLPPRGRSPPASSAEPARKRLRIGEGGCRNCGREGHWYRECPDRAVVNKAHDPVFGLN